MPTFRATLLAHGRTATGFEVPPEIVEELDAGKRPAVTVTINGHTYRSSIAPRGDRFLLGVSADNRTAASVQAGDEVDVHVELDTQPRTVVVPSALQEQLETNSQARAAYEQLSYSRRQRLVLPIQQAKTPETRARRVDKAIEELKAQKP